MTKREAKDLGWRCLTLYLPLILFLIGTLFPFYWIVNTSLKDSVEVLSLPIKYWPDNPTLSNYSYLFEKMGFGNNVANTAFVAALTTVLVTLLSLLSGYAMSRYRFYGKTFIYVLMLATQMLPAVVLMIPLFQTDGQAAPHQQPVEPGADLHLHEPSLLYVHDDGLLQLSPA